MVGPRLKEPSPSRAPLARADPKAQEGPMDGPRAMTPLSCERPQLLSRGPGPAPTAQALRFTRPATLWDAGSALVAKQGSQFTDAEWLQRPPAAHRGPLVVADSCPESWHAYVCSVPAFVPEMISMLTGPYARSGLWSSPPSHCPHSRITPVSWLAQPVLFAVAPKLEQRVAHSRHSTTGD